jgi:hypothetical protein
VNDYLYEANGNVSRKSTLGHDRGDSSRGQLQGSGRFSS